jgi:glycosyltransferase involved in cell wall biosynthesis
LKVIYNGIDCDNFERAEPALDHGGAQFVVGTVGRLTPQKNPEGFLKAAREVVKELPHCRFLFIGDGEEQSRLEQLTKQWHLESNVQFLGFRADMPNVYASLDLFVLPSLLENFPMSILESMAAGIPVIATRVGSVEKLVRDQETGILLRRGDQAGLNEAILHLLSDPVLMRKLGNTGRQWVKEHFSDQVMAEEYLSLYRDAGAPG